MSSTDLAWLAGMYEGEGTFYLAKAWGKKNPLAAPAMCLTSTDEDVLVRVAALMGNKSYSRRKLPSGKTAYKAVKRGVPAMTLMLTLFPVMGKRRQEKISEVLAQWEHGAR